MRLAAAAPAAVVEERAEAVHGASALVPSAYDSSSEGVVLRLHAGIDVLLLLLWLLVASLPTRTTLYY